MEHRLVDGTLYVEGEKPNRGIIGRCTCGWSTGMRITGLAASAAFQDHQDEMKKKETEAAP